MMGIIYSHKSIYLVDLHNFESSLAFNNIWLAFEGEGVRFATHIFCQMLEKGFKKFQ